MYDEMNKWMTLLVSVAYLHDLHIEKNWKLRIVKSICMFMCLHYDNRQSTALCITQHHTVSTCSRSNRLAFRCFSTSRFALYTLFVSACFSNRLVVSRAGTWVAAHFDRRSRLSDAYPTLKGLGVVFAGFVSLGIHIPEYIYCKQQH